ncbi:MAG: type II secretion system protein GspN [Kofleriaceae bacterium]
MALPQLPQLGPRMRKVVRVLGYLALALITFVFALQLTFPYDRVKDRIQDVLSAKYDVSIGSVERGIMPGRMYLKWVTLQKRGNEAPPPPAAAEGSDTPAAPPPPAKLVIESLELDVGLLALLGGTAEINFDAEISPGHLVGTIALSKTSTAVEVEGIALPSNRLPVQDYTDLPMTGRLDFAFSLTLPKEKNKNGQIANDWTKATGALSFDCATGCTFGPGKMKPPVKDHRRQVVLGDGVAIGKIFVEKLAIRVDIKSSRLELTKFELASKDGEVHFDYTMTLAPVFDDSLVSGCLRFKDSPELEKREPKTSAALINSGAERRADGLFHIRLDGTFKKMKRLNQMCGPAVKSANMDDPGGSGGGERPTLTIQPPEDSAKNSAAPPTPPPPGDAAVPVPVPGPEGEHAGSGAAGSAGAGSAGSGSAGSGSAEAGSAGSGSAGSGSAAVPGDPGAPPPVERPKDALNEPD